MNIEKVEMYKTSNGQVFETIEEATKQQARLDFIDWYYRDDNELICTHGGSVAPDDVLDWLRINGHEVLVILDKL